MSREDREDDEGAYLAGLFSLPPEGEHEPREIADRLVETCEEFQQLKDGEVVLMLLMRHEEKVKQGRRILGEIALPRFMGPLAPLASWLLAKACDGHMPDYIVWFDAEWWAEATPIQREALVYHELCHAEQAADRDGEPKFDDAGRPVWTIKGHDVEEFSAVVRRYGAWSPDIRLFIAALREGGAV